MTTSQHEFTVEHYAPRAQAYVDSVTHSSGDDLDQMETLLRGRDFGRVLDLGCGGGHVSYRAALHVGEVVACDVTQGMLDVVARTAVERGFDNIKIRQAPAERLPFADASFDAVLCRFTTHHWQDMESGLREARRVVKTNGLAFFMDVVAPPERVFDTHLQAVEVLRDASHVRNYSVAEWLSALARAGFAIESVTTRKLRMIFPTWIARTRTAPEMALAIRQFQAGVSDDVRRHFDIAEDGSFDLDTATMVLRAA